jgi:hypothetical protein
MQSSSLFFSFLFFFLFFKTTVLTVSFLANKYSMYEQQEAIGNAHSSGIRYQSDFPLYPPKKRVIFPWKWRQGSCSLKTLAQATASCSIGMWAVACLVCMQLYTKVYTISLILYVLQKDQIFHYGLLEITTMDCRLHTSHPLLHHAKDIIRLLASKRSNPGIMTAP